VHPREPPECDTYLPTRGPTATRDGIFALARDGERLGLHSAMIADHIVFPVQSRSTYPYTVDGRHPSIGDALETFSIPTPYPPDKMICPAAQRPPGSSSHRTPSWRKQDSNPRSPRPPAKET
jgi:hypothetical protein